jgi:WD40 repeat protein
MASALSLSKVGLEIVDRARRQKGWNKAEIAWQVQADVSKSTLDRFWMQKPIKQQNFVAICLALGISDWQQVADLPPIAAVPMRRGSNLGQVSEPVILELDGFAQRIFDWFKALEFDRESDPRRESNYVEWVIKVVMRSRIDRVLIRAIIHEVGLGDLDGLRRSVADLRVDEGWLVTSLWVSPAVKQVLNKSEEGLTCLTFDELIDQDANFAPYLAWLKAEIRRRELEKYYVPLGCTKGEFDGGTKTLRAVSNYPVSEGGIDLYIDRWLENPMNEHVSILGEFGTGKTWFVLHYAGRCLRAYLEAKRKGLPRPRLPLVIPLRDYAKALNVENVLAGFFYTQHNIRLNSAVFDRLNQMGKLLLIFDGFDEMADKVDHQKMIDNFWELAKVVTTNAKVILTCRTEHFPTAQVGRDTLRGELLASTARLTGVPPQFETLELMKFDDVQIREVLGRRTNGVTVEKVMGNGQVLDLLRRAVMAEFVLAALPEIEAGAEIDLARVYLYAVRRQMEENITTGRTFTSLADKLYFLCELSWEMLSTDRMSLNYREFPDLLKKFFGAEVESQKDLDHWHYDMMGQTMLVRNDDGDYSPAHRSLLEFFAAYKLAAELGLLAPDFLEIAQIQPGINEDLESQDYNWSTYWRKAIEEGGNRQIIAPLLKFQQESPKKLRDTFGKTPLTKTLLDLHLLMLDSNREKATLLGLIQFTKGKTFDESGYLGGNAATILVKAEPYILDYQDLSGANLSCADLSNAGFRETNLSEAILDGSQITRVIGKTNSIVIDEVNQRFITAHNNRMIRIWDMVSGKELGKISGHRNDINCLAISKDGKFLYSGGDDHIIKEWRLSDGGFQRDFTGHELSINEIILSDDNKTIYSASNDKTIKVWNILNGVCECTFVGHKDWVSSIALNSEEKMIYSASNDETIKEWNLTNGTCQRTFTGHKSIVRSIAINKNRSLLYSGSFDKTIKEWNLTNGACQRTFTGHQSMVRAISLSADGLYLYSGSFDKTIKEWDLDSGICQRTLIGHKSMVRVIALSNDKKTIYSGSDDQIIKEWDLSNGICQRSFVGHQSVVRAIVLNSNGDLLYSGGDGKTIKEWNLSDKRCQRTFAGNQSMVRTIALGSDERFLYSSGDGRTIKEWNLKSGVCQRTFIGHRDWVKAIAVSQDGRFLYSGGADTIIKEWSLIDGNCTRTFIGHNDWVMTITLSADGQFMYSGSNDQTIKEWSLIDGNCTGTLSENQSMIRTIAVSKDRRFLYSGGADATIQEWSLTDGSYQRTFTGHKDWVRTIALSDDGCFLYSGSNDKTIKEWDLSNGSCQQTLAGHDNWVMTIAISKNERTLYSGSDDQSIKEWDIATGKCLRTIDCRLYAGAKITNIKGLTTEQIDDIISLGASV